MRHNPLLLLQIPAFSGMSQEEPVPGDPVTISQGRYTHRPLSRHYPLNAPSGHSGNNRPWTPGHVLRDRRSYGIFLEFFHCNKTAVWLTFKLDAPAIMNLA